MSGWLKIHRSDDVLALLRLHPNAYLLLSQIALRARWKDCPLRNLKAGQAFIGDWKAAGLPSQKAYRCAKEVLERGGLVAFKGANKGTVATLVTSTIFDLSTDDEGEQRGNLGASQGLAEGEQGATNIERKTEDRKTSHVEFAETGFLHITPEHFKKWEENSADGVDVDFELEKAEAWLRENKKPKSYGMFLLNWMKRAKPSSADPIRPLNSTADNFELKSFSADQLGLKR